MTLFNSSNPRIAAAHAQVIETLAGIPEEYGAVFVIADLQDMHGGELPVAVREHTKRQAALKAGKRLNALQAAKKRRALRVVVGLDGRRAA